MFRRAQVLGIVTSLLMLGAALTTAQALDLGGVSIGSGDSGGTTASAGTGDTSVGATLGGSSNIANVGLGTGGTDLNAAIGNTSGDLITTSSDGGATQANVNLGSLGLGSTPNDALNSLTDPLGSTLEGVNLGGLPGLPGGGGGGGAGGSAAISAGFAGLAPVDQQLLRARCGTVLSSPGSFAANVVALCRVIARL